VVLAEKLTNFIKRDTSQEKAWIMHVMQY